MINLDNSKSICYDPLEPHRPYYLIINDIDHLHEDQLISRSTRRAIYTIIFLIKNSLLKEFSSD